LILLVSLETVIATMADQSEAKQSWFSLQDCFVASLLAMTWGSLAKSMFQLPVLSNDRTGTTNL